MSDYNTNESVIYKIHCLDNSCDFVYFGSTKDYKARKRLHKFDCNNINGKNYNSKIYDTIRANGGFGNWIMEIVEVFPCENKRDLLIREQWYIDSAKGKINSIRAYVSEEQRKVNKKETKKQYYLAHKDEVLEYQKQYNLTNKDKVRERSRLYNLANKERLLEDKNQIESI